MSRGRWWRDRAAVFLQAIVGQVWTLADGASVLAVAPHKLAQQHVALPSWLFHSSFTKCSKVLALPLPSAHSGGFEERHLKQTKVFDSHDP
jgi:hypothetical protein